MDDEFRWPQKGDNPFLVTAIELNSSTWASLPWLASLKVDDSFLAAAFKEAGDKIVKELGRSEDFQHPDKFFMPIAYLYRHSLELKMKTIVRLGRSLELIESGQKLSRVLRSHNLYQLWNFVRAVVEVYSPDERQDGINLLNE